MAKKIVIEMYSIHNEGIFVIAKRFIRILKSIIHDFSFKKCVYWQIKWHNW